MNIPREPSRGDSILPWATGVNSCLRRMRMTAGPGIIVDQTANGTAISVNLPPPPPPPRLHDIGLAELLPNPLDVMSHVLEDVFTEFNTNLPTANDIAGELQTFLGTATAELMPGYADVASWVESLVLAIIEQTSTPSLSALIQPLDNLQDGSDLRDLLLTLFADALDTLANIYSILEEKLNDYMGISATLTAFFADRSPRSGDYLYTDELGIVFAVFPDGAEGAPSPNFPWRIRFQVNEKKWYAITTFPAPDLEAIIRMLADILRHGLRAAIDMAAGTTSAVVETAANLAQQSLESALGIPEGVARAIRPFLALWAHYDEITQLLTISTPLAPVQQEIHLAEQITQKRDPAGTVKLLHFVDYTSANITADSTLGSKFLAKTPTTRVEMEASETIASVFGTGPNSVTNFLLRAQAGDTSFLRVYGSNQNVYNTIATETNKAFVWGYALDTLWNYMLQAASDRAYLSLYGDSGQYAEIKADNSKSVVYGYFGESIWNYKMEALATKAYLSLYGDAGQYAEIKADDSKSVVYGYFGQTIWNYKMEALATKAYLSLYGDAGQFAGLDADANRSLLRGYASNGAAGEYQAFASATEAYIEAKFSGGGGKVNAWADDEYANLTVTSPGGSKIEIKKGTEKTILIRTEDIPAGVTEIKLREIEICGGQKILVLCSEPYGGGA